MATVRTIGARELLAATKAVAAKVDATGRAVTAKQAAVLESEMKKNFIGSHAKGQPHVGGNRPNVVTGNLRRSIVTDAIVREGLGWKTQVGPTAIYGRRVELGYAGGSGGRGHQATRAFPYVQPAVEGSKARMAAIALAEWGALFAG